jgi:hypothetical protein
MKTRYFVLYLLGCVGVASCLYFGPTSPAGAIVGIGLFLVMAVAMYIVVLLNARDEDRPPFLRRKNPMSASDAIMHNIDGTGTGWELDDLMTWSPTPEQQEKAIRPLITA